MNTRVLIFVLSLALILPAAAAETDLGRENATVLAQNQGQPVPPPPSVTARSYILQDFLTGETLAENNADARMEPASITKLMTGYVAFKALSEGKIKLTDNVPISEKAWRTEGSRSFVEVNTKVPLDTLLKGMIVQSGNDATVAVAEHSAGSEDSFVALMNSYAQALGMGNSHFTNSTGLPDPDLYTTARDIATLARAIIREFPEYYKMYSIKEFTYNTITQHNRNQLLWRDESVDGMKTGHTESAGFCLVASARREGMRLVSVVLGTENENLRATESLELLNYGFRSFETHRLYSTRKPLSTVRVWKGETDSVRLGLGEDLYITVPRGQYKNLKATMEIGTDILAPIQKGQQKGLVRITLGEEVLLERPLIALESVNEGGWWQRIVDSIKLWFDEVTG
jgi:D-alanyl-D-alanine carboxypeptidase (penicillin-binding protein 5/6)